MTDAASFFSTQFLPTFIDVYRSHRCLWDVKSPDYSQRPAKTAAYKQLIQIARRAVPNCGLDFVKRKIDILRGSFRREYNKVMESMKPENWNGTVYKPKLWYYHLLLFLKDEDETERMTRALDDGLGQDFQEVETLPGDEAEGGAAFEVEPESPPTPSTAETTPTYGHPKRSRSEDDEAAAAMLRQDSSLLDHHHQDHDDEFDKFGAVVAAKLRRMTPMQEIYAENLINQVLFNGMLGRLQENSSIELQDTQLYNGTD